MEFTIEKNFDFGVLDYPQMNLKTEVKQAIQELKLPEFLLHKHVLPAMLEPRDIIISSPPATGKSSLLAIALYQLLNKQQKTLQFIILEGMDHLVKETYTSLLNFQGSSAVKFSVSDKLSVLKQDYKEFNGCQVAIANRFKLLQLLKRAHRRYETLKYVIFDASRPDDPKILEIMDLLKEKAPQVTYWWFNKIKNQTDEDVVFQNQYFTHPYTAYVSLNCETIKSLNHFYIQVENSEQEEYFIKKIINQTDDVQKILFIHEDSETNKYKELLRAHRPGVIYTGTPHPASVAILTDFRKNLFNVLICPAKQFYARRIVTERSVYVIMLQCPDIETYGILSKRAGYSNNDRVYTFTNNNDQISSIEDISESYKINIRRWPNPNDE